MSEPIDDTPDMAELFATLNPVAETDLPQASDSLSAQALFQYLTGEPLQPDRARATGTRPDRTGPGRRWLVGAIAAVLAMAGLGFGGAYAGLFTNSITQHLNVICYSAPSLQSPETVIAAIPQGPVASCAQAWTQGQVGSGPVPLLVACVTHEGVAAVFPSPPGASVCEQLDLPALPAGATNVNVTTTVPPPTTLPSGSMPAAMRNAIVSQLQQTCLSAALAKDSLIRLLSNAGVHWSVTVRPFPPGRPCASPGFNEQDRVIVIVGIPPLPGMSSNG